MRLLWKTERYILNLKFIPHHYYLIYEIITANDVLLSHMITFLNDKEDTALRGSFFDCIIGVAAYVGWHCSHILVPLLQQVKINI